ncbi:hypothetical protein NMP99_00755 [Glutamicibacter mishrai]|uniref:hypothetical protein n=1 Tax=Glutamicibacter mishrai TaxID=1775880 RepID=UPI0020CBCE0E|nr:hypothetical protein [Glutamicibacter mishrai]UTT39882.1 hypothetical protein NMP99_00755 [Glutamicibacter mishrai]
MFNNSELIDKILAADSLSEYLLLCNIDSDSCIGSFAAGSIIQGWGNRDSDIDIYLIVESLPPDYSLDDVHTSRGIQGDVHVTSKELFGRKTDIEVWTIDQVMSVLDKMNVGESEYSSSLLLGFNYFELDFMEKLNHGRAIAGSLTVDQLKRKLKSSAWRDLLIEQALHLSDIYLEDALGQLDASDLRSAILSAKLAFGHSVDAVCINSGQIGHSPKWRAKRMETISDSCMSFEDYWAIETMASYSPEQGERWATEVIRMCRKISANIPVR